MKEIKIYNNKYKYGIWLIVTFLFVLMGIKLITSNHTFDHILGIGNILIFGFCFYIFLQEFINKKAKLIIDEKGITDQVSYTSAGEIAWNQIESISSFKKILIQKFIKVELKQPEKFIAEAKTDRLKKSYQIFYKKYGTPVIIPIHMLNMKSKKIEQYLMDYFKNS